MFHAGQKFGRYRLQRKLARGGFGEVWLAEKQSQLVTRKVAVKLPNDEQVDFATIQREAQLWEEASGHPNVLPLVDADIYDGQVLIVSEFVEEGSLADKLQSEGVLPVATAIEIAVGVLNGLEFLHSKNIIHRDIKPANILMQNDVPRLADFGISRALQATSVSSKIVGTETYMSPESFEGVRSVQTDIWSVGVLLYKILSGYLPFTGAGPAETMYEILMKEPQPLPTNVPPRLREIILKALEKDRDLNGQPPRRYQTAAAMREDLKAFLDNFSGAPAPVPMVEPVAPVAPGPVAAPETTGPEESRATHYKMQIPLTAESRFRQRVTRLQNSPKIVLLLVIGLVGFIALTFVYLFSRPAATDSRAAQSPAAEQPADAQPTIAPADAEASKEFYRRGDDFYAQKKYKQAVEAYTKAIELNPKDPGLYNNRGIIYHIQREFEKAVADYTKAAELNPTHFSSYNNRGLVYDEMGKKEEAVADFQKALDLDPDNKLAKENLEKALRKR